MALIIGDSNMHFLHITPSTFHYPRLICCIYLAGGSGFSVQLLLSSHESFWICLEFLLQNTIPVARPNEQVQLRAQLGPCSIQFQVMFHIWGAVLGWWRQHTCVVIPAPTCPKPLQDLGVRDHSKHVPLQVGVQMHNETLAGILFLFFTIKKPAVCSILLKS